MCNSKWKATLFFVHLWMQWNGTIVQRVERIVKETPLLSPPRYDREQPTTGQENWKGSSSSEMEYQSTTDRLRAEMDPAHHNQLTAIVKRWGTGYKENSIKGTERWGKTKNNRGETMPSMPALQIVIQNVCGKEREHPGRVEIKRYFVC